MDSKFLTVGKKNKKNLTEIKTKQNKQTIILVIYVTVHKYLSQDGSLFYARVTSGQSDTWPLAK